MASWDDVLDDFAGWLTQQRSRLADPSASMPGPFPNPVMATPIPPRLHARAHALVATASELAGEAKRRKAVAGTELVRLRAVALADQSHAGPAAFVDIKA